MNKVTAFDTLIGEVSSVRLVLHQLVNDSFRGVFATYSGCALGLKPNELSLGFRFESHRTN